MSFRFSLQKILDLRTIQAQEALNQVDSTKKIILQLKELLDKERELYFSERNSLNNSVKKIEFTEIKIFEKSLALRQNKMMELLKTLREVQIDLRVQEGLFIEAKKNKKIIENLYEIKSEEFRKKEQKEEQYVMDELATQRFFKHRLEEENEE